MCMQVHVDDGRGRGGLRSDPASWSDRKGRQGDHHPEPHSTAMLWVQDSPGVVGRGDVVVQRTSRHSGTPQRVPAHQCLPSQRTGDRGATWSANRLRRPPTRDACWGGARVLTTRWLWARELPKSPSPKSPSFDRPAAGAYNWGSSSHEVGQWRSWERA